MSRRNKARVEYVVNGRPATMRAFDRACAAPVVAAPTPVVAPETPAEVQFAAQKAVAP